MILVIYILSAVAAWLQIAVAMDAVPAALPLPVPVAVLKESHLWEEFLLGTLAVAFMAWAGVVAQASRSLSSKMESMKHEFHKYAVEVEHRITEMEMVVSQINKLVTRMLDNEEPK